MTDYLKLRVPATSANLGAGFDVFGIALEIPYDIIEVERSHRTGITVTGRDSQHVPVDLRKNTAGIVASVSWKTRENYNTQEHSALKRAREQRSPCSRGSVRAQ